MILRFLFRSVCPCLVWENDESIAGFLAGLLRDFWNWHLTMKKALEKATNEAP